MLVSYALLFLIGTFMSWVSLLIVVPISQKIAEFSFPPWDESLWKLFVVAAACSVVSTAAGPISGYLAIGLRAAALWTLLAKWFDVDYFGAVVITFVTSIVNTILFFVIVGLIGLPHAA